jgi:hypothetical protein
LEVLVAPEEAEGLRVLLAAIREGRIDADTLPAIDVLPAADRTQAALAPVALDPLGPIVIEPLTPAAF